MKIIEQKADPKNWSKRQWCPNCESVMLVEEGDLTLRKSALSTEKEPWGYACYICPCCGKRNVVDAPEQVLVRVALQDRIPR